MRRRSECKWPNFLVVRLNNSPVPSNEYLEDIFEDIFIEYVMAIILRPYATSP